MTPISRRLPNRIGSSIVLVALAASLGSCGEGETPTVGSSSWSPAAGYIRVDSVKAGNNTNYLWIMDQGGDRCFLVEAVNANNVHLGAVGGCGAASTPQSSISRILESHVGRVPDKSATSVVFRNSGGQELGRAALHKGQFILNGNTLPGKQTVLVSTVYANDAESEAVEVSIV